MLPTGEWRNRIVGSGVEDAEQLLANPKNWRVHPKAQQDALCGVLREIGWVQNVIVNQRTGYVIDGHARVALAITKGEQVPVVYVDLDENEEAIVLASLDPLAAMACTDKDLLAGVLADLKVSDADLAAMLANLGETNGIEQIPAVGLTEDDAVPVLPVDPATVQGDVWLLGNHRLMCGDSISINAVERLMDGEKADMVFTDPPYGIDLLKKVGGLGKSQEYRPVIGDDSTDTATDAYRLCAGLGIPTLVFWGANHYANALPPSSCWLVWDKQAGKSVTFADCELAWTNLDRPVRLFTHIWDGFRRDSERGEQRVHPTQKPVALAEWAFKEFGEGAGLVLDLFGGSGSTLIACEKAGRSARLMELDPKYCDVICRRFMDFTGKQATLEGDGRTFAEISSERMVTA